MKFLSLLLLLISFYSAAQTKRARDYGIPFNGTTGTYNSITDVAGVTVGHTTLIKGEGSLRKGEGPIRTGVTAILPHGKEFIPVYANFYALNGNGDMTGTHWITESGFLETPILIPIQAMWELSAMLHGNGWTNTNTILRFLKITGMHIPWLLKRMMAF